MEFRFAIIILSIPGMFNQPAGTNKPYVTTATAKK
jgi:hypothetical protein